MYSLATLPFIRTWPRQRIMDAFTRFVVVKELEPEDGNGKADLGRKWRWEMNWAIKIVENLHNFWGKEKENFNEVEGVDIYEDV